MRIFDRIKNFVNDHPIATGLTTGSTLLLAGMPIIAGVSTLFIGSGAANATIKFIAKRIATAYGEELPPGTLRFKDKGDAVLFEFNETVPSNSINIRIPASDGHAAKCYRVNSTLLESYFLYRKAVVNSYGQKPDLAQDIKQPTQSRVPELDGTASYETFVTKKAKLNSHERGLDQYSIAACLNVMQRWKDDAQEHMQSFIAYENINGYKINLGFVLFQEKVIDGKPTIYIAEAAVSRPGTSIGRRLMEAVLTHFPAGTEFHILTRKFNSEASNLYGKRLGFEPLSKDEVAKLDYDPERYIGFKHVSTQQELAAISGKQVSNIRPTLAV